MERVPVRQVLKDKTSRFFFVQICVTCAARFVGAAIYPQHKLRESKNKKLSKSL